MIYIKTNKLTKGGVKMDPTIEKIIRFTKSETKYLLITELLKNFEIVKSCKNNDELEELLYSLVDNI